MSKSKRVVPFVRVDSKTRVNGLIFNVVLVIFDVCPNPMPAKVFSLLQILTIARHFHAKIVQAVWLSEVYDVKADFAAFFCVPNPKEKPLCVTMCVDIVLKN